MNITEESDFEIVRAERKRSFVLQLHLSDLMFSVSA